MAKYSMRTIIRSERYAAISLASAAVLALFLANSVAGPGIITLMDSYFPIEALGINLTLSKWISDGLLAIFFFIIAVELRHELTEGELNTFQHALAPSVAAIGGVVVPAGLYLLIAGADYSQGWPIPVATDIAFALGLIALLGKGLPAKIRIFLLALAILDDLIAILIIAVFFTDNIDFIAMGMAIIAVFLFRYLGCNARMPEKLRVVLLIVVALLAWYFTLLSGVHATIAGVALGLVLQPKRAEAAVHALQPFTNAVVLPLFAFASALVIIPAIPLSELSPAFWGIAVSLPVGKILGIMLFGTIVAMFARGDARKTLVKGMDLLTVAAVAGIGFTVSLLMNELAFESMPLIQDEGVLGVLVGSAISIVVGGTLVRMRAKRARRSGKKTAKKTAQSPAQK
jgi:NhaA family Na+:H+ antiporter